MAVYYRETDNYRKSPAFLNAVEPTLKESASMPSLPTFQEYVSALRVNRGTTYSLASALTLCAYDILLSFGQEVKYIWPSKWSAPKLLYILVRYYGISLIISIVWANSFSTPDVEFCNRYFLWITPGGISVFVAALNIILLLRISALFNGKKLLTTFLLVLVVVDIAIVLWASIVAGMRTGEEVFTVPAPWLGCASDVSNAMLRKIVFAFVLNNILSLLFLALSLQKLFESYRLLSRSLTWKTLRDVERSVSPLLFVFVRDGSLYFALTSIASLLLILGGYVVEGPVRKAIIPWALVLYSYSGAHLILDLRAAGAEQHTDLTWNQTPSLFAGSDELDSGIRFSPADSFRSQGTSGSS